ncbi:DUF1983 domain-containing protein, partial [Xenorhabdus sp. ZM]|uniref:phage tail protein n=1 Tax=Xenorhabdus szentirmaii TaxID=290112 RepID=UPI0019898412
YSQTNDGEGLMLLADIPYPQRTHTMQGLAAGVAFYFRARLVDKSGNPSPWTDFVRGESSTDTRWIVQAAGDQFLTTEAGKRIQADVDWNTESSLMLSNMQQTLSRDLMVRDGENKAQISELWAVRVTDKEATAQQLTEIRTNLGNTAADVITNKQAISDTQKAQAEKMDQVQAQLGDQKAMINTKMQAEFNQTGNGYAMHSTNITLKYNGQKYNAGGMVISGEVKNGQLESYIGFSANNFAFFNPVSGKPVPFMVVKNGQMFIQDLFIDKALFNEARVAERITSNNYIPSQQGFTLDAKRNTFDINGNGIRINRNGIKLYDTNGKLRIEMVVE